MPWVTSTTTAASAPNDAFAPDVNNKGNTELVTPMITLPAGGGTLTFQNLYNMQATAATGFDGMVLEVRINGVGAFADILAAGGSFVTGGYTHTISADFGNPIAGRMAWSGLSGGTTDAPAYVTTTVNLPTAANGQNIQLKWRAATDTSGVAPGAAGVRIDKIVITPASCGTAPPTPTPSIPPSATPSSSPTATVPGSPAPTPTPGITPAQAANFSTRLRVQTGDNVGIGGFIITGSVPKRVIVRAIGPFLSQFGITDFLADPVLELRGPCINTITNDNWRDTQEAEIEATGLPPTDNFESAIVAVLAPGVYTAIIKGKNNTSGMALVEVYDLNPAANSKLANIATRAFVGLGDDIIIAGFILGNNSGVDQIIARGIGPSLSAAGVPNVLANPTLELRDNNGSLIFSNNDWEDNPTQAAIIIANGLAPSNNLESAIAATLPPGLYTALVAGLNSGTGVGVVEVYDRGDGTGSPPPPPCATPTPGGSPTPPPSSPTPPPGGTPTPTPPGSTPTPPPSSPTPPPGGCMENFDGVTAPALPAGWVNTVISGDPPGWITSTATPDTAPNHAFVNDQDGISDKTLETPNILVSSAAAQVSFRNSFNTEYDPPPNETFWDGGLLEVTTNNGTTWTDVIDAGGSFVSGPYTGEIDGTAMNPLAGRMAWSGNSGGYINSVINLPASFNGQTIRLRFRMGTDAAVAAQGWRVDGFAFTGGSCQ